MSGPLSATELRTWLVVRVVHRRAPLRLCGSSPGFGRGQASLRPPSTGLQGRM